MTVTWSSVPILQNSFGVFNQEGSLRFKRRHPIIAWVIFTALSIGLWTQPVVAGPVVGPEKAAALKVAYLRYIAEYTSWPDAVLSQDETPFTFCLLGRDNEGLTPLIDSLIVRKGIRIHNKTSQLKSLNPDQLNESLNTCHVLYIFSSEAQNWHNRVKQFQDRPVMTVSESEGFALNGGMVQFVRVKTKPSTTGFQYHLHINLKNCFRTELRLSSKFLGLRKTVKIVEMPVQD